MARLIFLILTFFYLTDIASLSYQKMAMLIHIILQKLRQYQCPDYGKAQNIKFFLKPNSKDKTKINVMYFQLLPTA